MKSDYSEEQQVVRSGCYKQEKTSNSPLLQTSLFEPSRNSFTHSEAPSRTISTRTYKRVCFHDAGAELYTC